MQRILETKYIFIAQKYITYHLVVFICPTFRFMPMSRWRQLKALILVG